MGTAEERDDTEDEEFVDYEAFERDCQNLSRPWTWTPLARRVGGVHVIDFADLDPIAGMPIFRKLLLLMLLLVLRDRSTDFVIETTRPGTVPEDDPDLPGLRALYQAGGHWGELIPPPACFRPYLIREVESLAGLRTLRRRLADGLRRLASAIDRTPEGSRKGSFAMIHDEDRIDIEVSAYRGEPGACVWLKFSPISEAASEKAGAALGRCLELFRW